MIPQSLIAFCFDEINLIKGWKRIVGGITIVCSFKNMVSIGY